MIRFQGWTSMPWEFWHVDKEFLSAKELANKFGQEWQKDDGCRFGFLRVLDNRMTMDVPCFMPMLGKSDIPCGHSTLVHGKERLGSWACITSWIDKFFVGICEAQGMSRSSLGATEVR